MINAFLKEKFNIKVEKSTVNAYSKEEWVRFCNARNLVNAEGIYIPRNHSAHILLETEFMEQNFFHEYYGHGLYIEHSANGKELHSLEKKLMEEEIANIKDMAELESFRENNTTYNELKEFCKENLSMYEGFAMWMEYYLSGLTGSLDRFEKKFMLMDDGRRLLCQRFIDYSMDYGEHALLYSCGFPKHYNAEIIEDILGRMFRKEAIDLALIYGSRKPDSDIDIFMVSEMPCCYFEWLDIYSVSRETFDDLVNKLDISITDALFSGAFVMGEKEILENAKSKVLKKKISKDDILFHRKHAIKAKHLAMKYPETAKEHKSAMRHHSSYLANADELEQGKKPLTLKNLIRKYPELKK